MGIAFLPDGRRMDYEDYLKSPEWRQKKKNRLAFDNWQCAFCHAELNEHYETHHLNYIRLGHEDIERDIVSVCYTCHKDFHNRWQKSNYWDQSPISHWKDYSLEDTAQFCAENLGNDFVFGGDYNLCSSDTICQFIDKYYQEHEADKHLFIYENDIKLFFRNKRYEVLFNAIEQGEALEDMLDRMFGKKGGAGGNPKRAEARRFFTKHKPSAMHRIYNENGNISILMDAADKIINKNVEDTL